MNERLINSDELNRKLNEAYKILSEESILEIAKRDAYTNNVVRGIYKDCFGIMADETGPVLDYTLIYINGSKELKGEILDLNIRDDIKFDLTMAFCNHLANEYSHLDIISTFNTFSEKLRSLLEMRDITTITNHDLGEYKDFDFRIFSRAKAIIQIPFIDRLEVYRALFKNIYKQAKEDNENVVYLMLDMNTSFVKIGRSINPVHREKTLQAQAPKIETIAFWKKPKETEQFLHEKFASNRIRGEWFKLSFKDLQKIDDYMQSGNWPLDLK